jgi:hypothetical protein
VNVEIARLRPVVNTPGGYVGQAGKAGNGPIGRLRPLCPLRPPSPLIGPARKTTPDLHHVPQTPDR